MGNERIPSFFPASRSQSVTLGAPLSWFGGVGDPPAGEGGRKKGQSPVGSQFRPLLHTLPCPVFRSRGREMPEEMDEASSPQSPLREGPKGPRTQNTHGKYGAPGDEASWWDYRAGESHR